MIVELMKDEKEDLKALAIFMVRLGLEFPTSPSIFLTASDIHSLQLFYFIFAKTLFVIFLPYHSSNCSNFFFPIFIYLFIFLRRAIAVAWFSVIYT